MRILTIGSWQGSFPDLRSVAAHCSKQNGGREASVPYSSLAIGVSSQPARGMREQGVDQTGFRGQVVAQRLRPAILARHLVEQPLELGDVAVERRLEAAVGAVLAGELVERPLAGRGGQALAERLALAALVAVPHLGREVAVHQPAD